MISDIDVDSNAIGVIMVSEAPASNAADNYAASSPFHEQTTVQAFYCHQRQCDCCGNRSLNED